MHNHSHHYTPYNHWSRRPSQPSGPPPPSHSPPLFTLQRPSIPNQPHLPAPEHIRPGSISDPRVPLSYHTKPPSQERRPSYPSSIPLHPSGLRYNSAPHRSASSGSPTFDLSQYSIGDVKPRASISPTGSTESHSPRQNRPPPLQLPSPTNSFRKSLYITSPPDGSRKRSRDDEFDTPDSELSRFSYIATPRSDSTEIFSQSRRGSNIDDLLITDRDSDVKPNILALDNSDWHRRGSIASLLGPKEISRMSDYNTQSDPNVSFPLQFGFNTGVASNNANNQADRNLNVDPALSSVRSSAADQGRSNDNSPRVGPEIHFSEDTLHSATGSPNLGQLTSDGGLKEEDHLAAPDGDKKDQPFSRSPELRISHKLAERKRRKEMKDLFDELRDLLPAERGSKSSKWEILSKSIDYVANLKTRNADLERELEKARRELDIARGGPAGYNAYLPHMAYSAGNYAGVANTAPQPGVGVGVGAQPQATSQVQQAVDGSDVNNAASVPAAVAAAVAAVTEGNQ